MKNWDLRRCKLVLERESSIMTVFILILMAQDIIMVLSNIFNTYYELYYVQQKMIISQILATKHVFVVEEN